ncbi:MAG: hypothetical protein KDK76_04190 [Chlamydiia bacterium]|nr:hypothetical protein [Chlamydiia bacterium]
MGRFLLFLVVLTSSIFAQKKVEDIRILNLLPYFVQPPLVDPCLPLDFSLGKDKKDPYFSNGYFWGTQGSTSDYFKDPSCLKGCLIRAQVSKTVKQIGYDRFSNDGNTQDLSAAGFTEIKVSKGRWGIFPYRELLAKGPKGRHYYQMWVGLNTEEGATLYFQFLYPEYLNEPTQTQKSIWANFVKKTNLLGVNDLLVARGVDLTPNFIQEKKLIEKVGLKVEKRKGDQKLFIHMGSIQKFSVLNIEQINLLNSPCLGQCIVEIDALIALNESEPSRKTFRVPYEVVESFTFKADMLNTSRFYETSKYLLFY